MCVLEEGSKVPNGRKENIMRTHPVLNCNGGCAHCGDGTFATGRPHCTRPGYAVPAIINIARGRRFFPALLPHLTLPITVPSTGRVIFRFPRKFFQTQNALPLLYTYNIRYLCTSPSFFDFSFSRFCPRVRVLDHTQQIGSGGRTSTSWTLMRQHTRVRLQYVCRHKNVYRYDGVAQYQSASFIMAYVYVISLSTALWNVSGKRFRRSKGTDWKYRWERSTGQKHDTKNRGCSWKKSHIRTVVTGGQTTNCSTDIWTSKSSYTRHDVVVPVGILMVRCTPRSPLRVSSVGICLGPRAMGTFIVKYSSWKLRNFFKCFRSILVLFSMYTRPGNLESPEALLYTPSAPTENGRMTRKIHLWPIREVTRVYSLAHGSGVVTAYIYCSRRVDQSTERARAHCLRTNKRKSFHRASASRSRISSSITTATTIIIMIITIIISVEK